jgi:hypothetical protein
VDWATGKAASIWAQFGKAPESTWKVCADLLTASDLRVVKEGFSSRSSHMERGWWTASNSRS